MKLSNKAQKIYNRLVKKSDSYSSGTRMPNIKSIVMVLNELGIKNSHSETETTKWRQNGLTYSTSGGTRCYTGTELYVSEINLHIDTTCSYYSWNTSMFARDLVKLINKTLNK